MHAKKTGRVASDLPIQLLSVTQAAWRRRQATALLLAASLVGALPVAASGLAEERTPAAQERTVV